MTMTKEAALLAEHAADLLASIPRPARPRDPVDQVDGVPVYARGHAPESMRSRSQLAAERRRPHDPRRPDGYVRARLHHNLVPLWELANTVAMRPMSAAQLAAWTVRRTCTRCGEFNPWRPQPYGGRCRPCDQAAREEEAEQRRRTCQGCGAVAVDPWPRSNRCEPCADAYEIEQQAEAAAQRERWRRQVRERRAPVEAWAREVLADPDAVTLDFETTGLDGAYAVEVAVTTMDGVPVLDTLINPRVPIPEDASDVHGITDADVRTAPTWPEVLPALVTALSGRRVVIYNAEFEADVMLTEMNRYQWQQDPDRRPRYAGELHPLAAEWVDGLRTECAMKKYARWVGELHSSGDYRYQPLHGDHRAAGDCRALVRLVRGLAAHQADAD